MRLDDDEHAVGKAREFARGWVSLMNLPPAPAFDVELVVDELVSNAVRHGVPPYAVDLSCVDGVVLGEVIDASSLEPHLQDHPDEHGGFGLRIVDACTTRWGFQVASPGKRVWFELPAH